MNKTYPINEIFYSLQGEGRNTGMPAVFIRFSGCNLSCHFCDTKHETFTRMGLKQIIQEVRQYPIAPLIVLTGGEPSLFVDCEFVQCLKEQTGKKIAIETNGTKALPNNLDWVTFSPKSIFEGGDGVAPVLKNCDELKVVYVGQELSIYDGITAKFRYLQPCATGEAQCDRQNLQQTIEAVKSHQGWILSLQTHKLINIQ